MFYFNKNLNDKNKQKDLINFRRKRKFILNKPINGKIFGRGDIVTINF